MRISVSVIKFNNNENTFCFVRVPLKSFPFFFFFSKTRFIQFFMLVPPIVLFMATHPLVDKYDLSSLRFTMSAAAPLGTDLAKKFLARLQANGAKDISLVQGYCLTETSPTTHQVPVEWSRKKIGSCGVLLPNMEARIVDDDGKDVILPPLKKKRKGHVRSSDDGRGELWVRGPNVMKGYLDHPSATADSITPDGWF